MAAQLTISLSALRHNLSQLQAHACGRVACVVKANAYGLGIDSVVPVFLDAGVREFFVATAIEGIRVRQVASALPEAVNIYVLEGVTDDPGTLLENDLMPVINSHEQLTAWSDRGRFALHVDTGMQRLGMPVAAASTLSATKLEQCVLVLSHLACADEPDHPFTAQQLAQCGSLFAHIKSIIPHKPPQMSVCNSAGLLAGLGPEDVGRAGIALYGGNPFTPGTDHPMRAVVQLRAPVLQLRRVAKGAPVGYGGTYVAPRDMTVATIGAGYADGIPRLLSNRGHAAWRDHRLPYIGRVSMDLIQLDASVAPEIGIGDTVELIGETVSLEQVAQWAQTIDYEVLTGLDSARRLHRQVQDAFLR